LFGFGTNAWPFQQAAAPCVIEMRSSDGGHVLICPPYTALLAYWVTVTPRGRRTLKRRTHLASQARRAAAR